MNKDLVVLLRFFARAWGIMIAKYRRRKPLLLYNTLVVEECYTAKYTNRHAPWRE